MLRSELRQRIRDYIDDTDVISADNFTDARINRDLLDAVKKAASLLSNFDDIYFRTELEQTVTTDLVALPNDFKTLIAYVKVDGKNIVPFEFKQLNDPITKVVGYVGNPLVVELIPGYIRYLGDIGSHTSRLTYVRKLVDIADGTDWGLPEEAERYAVLYAARSILKSENNKTESLKDLLEEARFDLTTLSPVKKLPRYVRYNGS